MRFVTFCSTSFMNRTKVLEESIKTHHPNIPLHIEITEEPQPGQYINNLPKRRFEYVKTLVDKNEDIILIGADCVLYARLNDYWNSGADVVLTPHVVYPPKERGSQLYSTGHANGDLVYFGNKSSHILDWLLKQEMTNKQHQGIFYEQTWLSSLPFIFDKVEICRNPGINLAWYNLNERKVDKYEDGYFIDCYKLRMVQYSGFIQGQPDKISKHYSGTCTDPVVLELFRDYNKKIS